MKRRTEDVARTKNHIVPHRRLECKHGNRDSGTSNKSSAALRRWLKDVPRTLWTPWCSRLNHPSRPRCYITHSRPNSECHRWKRSMASKILLTTSIPIRIRWSCMGIRPCPVQGVRHYFERPSHGLVQQNPPFNNLFVQGVIHSVRLPLHWSQDVQEAELPSVNHQAGDTGKFEVICAKIQCRVPEDRRT